MVLHHFTVNHLPKRWFATCLTIIFCVVKLIWYKFSIQNTTFCSAQPISNSIIIENTLINFHLRKCRIHICNIKYYCYCNCYFLFLGKGKQQKGLFKVFIFIVFAFIDVFILLTFDFKTIYFDALKLQKAT